MQLILLFRRALLVCGVYLLTPSLFALPQYAVKHRITRCTACHVSAAGGSVRNLNGKAYGTHLAKLPKVSQQDLVYADWRLLFFKAIDSTTTSEGAGIMAAQLSANVPLSDGSKEKETRFVFSHSLGGFSSERETYLSFRLRPESEASYLQYVQLGRILPPFGWRTDNHRTYTRIISQSTWNDLVMGAHFAGDPVEPLHYDLVILNGESSRTPGQLNPEKSDKWGTILNTRWMSRDPDWPILFGVSGAYYKRLQDTPGQSWSVYMTASLHRWTQGTIPVHLSAEVVEAENLNETNADLPLFVANTNYLDSLARTRSRGFLVHLDWEWNDRWTATYQYDEMILDIKYSGDYYRRHGIGARYQFAANAYLLGQYEWAEATHPSEKNASKLGGQDAFWSQARVSF